MQINKKITTSTLALLGILFFLNSCKKEYDTIQTIDDAKIQAYIKANNLTMKKDPAGFYYQVLSQGTGTPLLNKDSVIYNLAIKNLEGVAYYNTATYSSEGTYLGYVNPEAYRTALTDLNHGAKVRVILPSYLAYGKNGTSVVPSNEVIISELTTLPETKQWQVDDKFIREYLTAKGLNAIKDPSRVYYIVSQQGTGSTSVDISSTLTLKYTGRLLNGTVFDTSGDATTSASLDGLIKGWQILLGRTAGTKIRIFVPSDLGYGLEGGGQGIIPGKSCLDFDIEIVEVAN